MSLRSLQLAVQTVLRNNLADVSPYDFLEHEIGLQLNGQPPPDFAFKYLAIHPIAWEPGNINAHVGIHERYTIGVTLTVKAGEIPSGDLADYEFYTQGEGMEATLRRVMVLIHQSQDLLTLANAAVTGSDQHTRWLEWIGTDAEPRTELGTWVYSDNERDAANLAAYVQTARFRGGDRLQHRTVME